MAELKKLISERGQVKSGLTRCITNCEKALKSGTVQELQLLDERYMPLFEKFDHVQNRIEELDQGTDSSVHHSTERNDFERRYFRVFAAIRQRISELQSVTQPPRQATPSSNPSPSPSEPRANIRLPTIQLPTFDGNYSLWIKFRDTFDSLIHSNDSLPNIEKFHYLNSALKGDAARVIQSLGISDASYALAWNSLKDRYDDSNLLIHHHLEAIIESPKLTRESHVTLRQLLDDTTSHLSALQSLNKPVESLGETLIIHILAKKLDPTTKREWDKTQSVDLQNTDLKSMTRFLENHCKYLEKSAVERQSIPSKPQVSAGNRRGQVERVSSHVANNRTACSACKGNHPMYSCPEFRKLSPHERVRRVQQLNLCFNCLQAGHRSSTCTRGACKKCFQRHHSLLPLSSTIPPIVAPCETAANETSSETVQKPVALHQRNAVRPNLEGATQKLLSTAVVHIQDRNGHKHECRALIDPGSQMNFVTTEFAKKLDLPWNATNTEISGICGVARHVSRRTLVSLSSRHTSYRASLSCLVIPQITDTLPNLPVDVASIKIPPNITLADPHFGRPGKIDLLIGVDTCWDLFCVGQHRLQSGQPVFQKTLLGWIAGGMAPIVNSATVKRVASHLVTNQELNEQINRFWEIEHCDATESQPRLDKTNVCERIFSETTTRDADGRFVVAIPVKAEVKELGESRFMAEKRFCNLERKFQRNPCLKEKYVEFMREYEALEHMSVIVDETIATNSFGYFLPHHPVYKETSTTTKLRVVFDGSAKTSTGLSLNEVQFVGPTVQNDLFSIVTRFRKHLYVMSADIEKMYRQIRVRAEDRHLQRILWRSDRSMPIKTYEMNTVTYGTASAPFLATRALRQVGEDHRTDFPKASHAIVRDFYVDDLLTGASSIEEAQQLRREISTILESAGFPLRKWASNDPRILYEIEHPHERSVEIHAEKDPKTLGLLWNAKKDELRYSVKELSDQKITKRYILSDISQIFDPLGLIGPATIQAKIMLQKLWQLQVSWDESVPQDIFTNWRTFRQELTLINKIVIPRHIFGLETCKPELHGFCDASERAYGACVYLRARDEQGTCIVRLVAAKSSVAPLKTVSLPRLELCGAVLLAQLISKVRDALDIGNHEEFFWCDSMVALAWIQGPPTRWKTFVANRTSEIQRLTNLNWNHVSSADNPADIISRGINPGALLSAKLWWDGPTWLSEDNSTWPSSAVTLQNVPESKSNECSLVASFREPFNLAERYSSWRKLQNVTSYCLRFIKNTRISVRLRKCTSRETGESRITGPLSSIERLTAEHVLLKFAQSSQFSEERKTLMKGQPVARDSKLSCLNPFIDNSGLIRVGGRLVNAPISYEQKHPVVLPSKHPITNLLIRHEHLRLLHAGCQAVIASIRTRYWPLCCKNAVKLTIRTCITCFRAKPHTIEHIMGNLPASRVTPTRAFHSCGVDYAGPFLIKEKTRGRTILKAYICIFVCFTSKAVHIELAIDLTTDAFINCLRRFISRRGLCHRIFSDNGTNFIGARNELYELGVLLSRKDHCDRVTTFLNDHQIEWNLIPPRAPHFGGLWESAVKAAKKHLIRVVGNTKLTYEELYTLLTQVEACLNSRPISPLSNDPNDLSPLTPGHFLIGDALLALPDPDIREIKDARLNRYQHIQKMLQHFWHRWQGECLHQLQQRNKWRAAIPTEFGPGTLVIIQEDNLPPLQWRLGRIAELHPGKDNVVRVASIHVAGGTIKRPVTKLCILPIDEENSRPSRHVTDPATTSANEGAHAQGTQHHTNAVETSVEIHRLLYNLRVTQCHKQSWYDSVSVRDD